MLLFSSPIVKLICDRFRILAESRLVMRVRGMGSGAGMSRAGWRLGVWLWGCSGRVWGGRGSLSLSFEYDRNEPQYYKIYSTCSY